MGAGVLSRLIAVSNRVAVPGPRTAPGGLAVGLLAALSSSRGLWFGWDGTTHAHHPSDKDLKYQTSQGVEFVTFALSRRDYDNYYKGFANSVLWPLFHARLKQVDYRQQFYEAYQRVNEMFAERLIPLIEDDDVVWVHDYHCLLMADELRNRGVHNRLGFFLHIPFPPYDVYRALPYHDHILRLLCRYDLVGFQTRLDLNCFLDCVRYVLPEARIQRNSIEIDGRRCRVGVFPIGIDVDDVATHAVRGRRSPAGRRLQESLNNRRLIIGIDRLDYSKGLPERFRAFRWLLEHYSDTRGQVVLLQVAQPSRSDVPEYMEIRRELDHLAGQINGRFAEYDSVPLRYLSRGYARTTVLGFLAQSHIGLITPLRDGMNLVAKEYVAAQDPDNPGVLVLSYLTGTAAELDGGALMVNPYHIEGVAAAMHQALHMPLQERRERWEIMMAALRRNPVQGWARSFTRSLRTGSRRIQAPELN